MIRWKCADCDHVQYGHRFVCEKCGHNFGRVDPIEEEKTNVRPSKGQ